MNIFPSSDYIITEETNTFLSFMKGGASLLLETKEGGEGHLWPPLGSVPDHVTRRKAGNYIYNPVQKCD